MRRVGRRLGLLGVLALAALALASKEGEPEARAEIVRASGHVTLTNSREGAAIFTAASLRPGRSVSGRVAIRNTGTASARLWLSQADLQDSPGPGGGRLSRRLQLAARDTSSPGTIYAGPFAAMPRREAGVLAPGESRTFELTARLPSQPGGDDAYQGARTSVRYVWTAVGVSPAPMPAAPNECRLSMRVPARQRLLSRRRMTVRLRVSHRCRVTARAYVRDRSGRRRFLYGVRNRSLEPGRTYRLTMGLAPTVRQILKSRHRKAVRVHVTAGSEAVSRRARVR